MAHFGQFIFRTLWGFLPNVLWCIWLPASKLLPVGYFYTRDHPCWCVCYFFKKNCGVLSLPVLDVCKISDRAWNPPVLLIYLVVWIYGARKPLLENLFNSPIFVTKHFSVPRKNEVPEGICHVQGVRNFLEFGHIWAHTLHNSSSLITNPFLGRFR